MIEELYRGKFLALVREGRWEYANRVNATGAAYIVAVTPEHKLLLVEQYRIPCHARTIEMPAGITGDSDSPSGEEAAEAARRELLEETGYRAANMEPLTMGPASSGLGSEIVTLFLARDLVREGSGGGVEHEQIQVHEVPLRQVEPWLKQAAERGLLVDPKVYAGLYFLGRHGFDMAQHPS